MYHIKTDLRSVYMRCNNILHKSKVHRNILNSNHNHQGLMYFKHFGLFGSFYSYLSFTIKLKDNKYSYLCLWNKINAGWRGQLQASEVKLKQ